MFFWGFGETVDGAVVGIMICLGVCGGQFLDGVLEREGEERSHCFGV